MEDHINDSRFGIRQKGEGPIASQIHSMAKTAKGKYFSKERLANLSTEHYKNLKNPQQTLF